MKGLHGKHCDVYVVEEGRYCDLPATVCQDGRYRCDTHDPYRLFDNWEPAPQWAKVAKEDDRRLP